MKDFIKNTIYTSIGIVAVTNEKFKELVEDLIQNNHFTQDEGKRITDSFLYDLREQLDNINGSIQSKVDEVLMKYGFPSIYNFKDDVENYIKDVKENSTILLKLPSKK